MRQFARALVGLINEPDGLNLDAVKSLCAAFGGMLEKQVVCLRANHIPSIVLGTTSSKEIGIYLR